MSKILIIEDNQDVRENTAEILELANHEVKTASDGKEGVQVAKQESFDLIICDIMMPELDGYGVLHILSKNAATAKTPFIFLTAKADKADIRKGMNLGADDYLTKPFDDTELLDAIESRIKKTEAIEQQFTFGENGFDFLTQPSEVLSQLVQIDPGKTRTYKKKEVIYYEGDYPNRVYYLKSGSIKKSLTNDDGKELVMELVKPGQFFGYMPIFENSTYKEQAMAIEDSEVMLISKDSFTTLLSAERDIANRFIRILSNNIAEKEERLLKMAYASVKERTAELLLSLGETDNEISMTREDLAALVGTATESLIRTLSEFKDMGAITSKGRKIVIADKPKLEWISQVS